MLLAIAAMAAMYSRTAIGPLQETIRIALALSDNQIALLQGPALALPLAIAAIPLGLLVDRYSRVRLLLAAAAVNAIGSSITAWAPGFAMLFAARCLVGLAAPATAIAAVSLLADLHAPAQRGRATMVVVIGQSIGSSSAFALGGQLLAVSGSQPESWRWAMSWMAALMVPIVVSMFWLREPPRTDVVIRNPSVRAIWRELWRYRGMIATLLAGMAVVNLADGAALVWAAPALSRAFGLPPDRIGFIMATALLSGGILGPLVGGALADLSQRVAGPRRTITVLSGLTFLSVPTGFFAVMPGSLSACISLALFVMLGTAISVMTTAVAIIVIPNELRGLCLAIKTAAAVLFGLGLAPLTVSTLSGAMGGRDTIGRALMLVCATTSLLGVVTFAFGRRYFTPTAVQPEKVPA